MAPSDACCGDPTKSSRNPLYICSHADHWSLHDDDLNFLGMSMFSVRKSVPMAISLYRSTKSSLHSEMAPTTSKNQIVLHAFRGA